MPRKATKPRRTYRKRQYTDAERYAALKAIDACGGNMTEASAKTKIPYDTLYAWKHGFRSVSALQLYETERGDMAAAVEKVVWQILDVVPDKIKDAPLNHLMTGAGQGIEKMRLLRGESTNISQNDNRNTNVNLVKLLEMLSDEQLAKLRELVDSGGNSGDGPDTRRLPETSGIPPLERELSPILESGVQDQRPIDDVP